MKNLIKSNNQSGFTLIEILTAVAISSITMLIAAGAMVKVSNISQKIVTENEFEKARSEINSLFAFRSFCNSNMQNTFPIWPYVKNLAKNTLPAGADVNNVAFNTLTDDVKKDFSARMSRSANIYLTGVKGNFILTQSTPSNIIANIQFEFEQKIPGTDSTKEKALTTITVPFVFKNFDSNDENLYSCYSQTSILEASTRELCSTYGGSLINGECRMPRYKRNVADFAVNQNKPRASAFSVQDVTKMNENNLDTMSFGDTLCYLDNLTIRAMFRMDGNSMDSYQANRKTLYCRNPSQVQKSTAVNDDYVKKMSSSVSKSVREYFPNFNFDGSTEVLNAKHKK